MLYSRLSIELALLFSFFFFYLQKPFKDRIDVNYEASPELSHKHRALAITRPLWNFTGEYLCSVSTYASNDKRSKQVQFIRKCFSPNSMCQKTKTFLFDSPLAVEIARYRNKR